VSSKQTTSSKKKDSSTVNVKGILPETLPDKFIATTSDKPIYQIRRANGSTIVEYNENNKKKFEYLSHDSINKIKSTGGIVRFSGVSNVQVGEILSILRNKTINLNPPNQGFAAARYSNKKRLSRGIYGK